MSPFSILARRRIAGIALLALAALPMPAIAAETAAGTVTIAADFPGGNVQVVKNEGAAVHVAPDLRGDNPWFYWYFEATATLPGRVSFVFPEKVIGATNGAIGRQGPAISLDQGRTWDWMGTATVAGPAFHYDFLKAGDKVRFAVTIPYLESNLAEFLERNAGNKHLQQRVLTTSKGGRVVELLQIGQPGTGVQPLIVTARHHATETMASYVLEGFLQAAMADTPGGEAFRKKYVLFAVPFVDKDGVERGDQGKNRKPHDHNRDYGPASIYPEVQAIRELDKVHDFKFSLDFHCPTLVAPDHQVMYFVGPKDHPANNFENISEFARWIKQGLPKEAPVGPLVWLTPQAAPKPMNSHYFGFKKGIVAAACLEFPFAPPGKATDPASCRRYGQVILDAWVNTHFIAAAAE